MRKFINRIKKIASIRIRFDLPESKKILKFDEGNIELLKKSIKYDFNVMPIRKLEVYFWIYIRQILLFDFSFSTYFKNYVKFTSTKLVISLLDNNLFCYKIKNELDGVFFISIQNGIRSTSEKIFQEKFNKFHKNLKCDHIFTHNKYILEEYKKIIDSDYHVLGNYINNASKINKTKYKNSYLFICTGHTNWDMRIGISYKLLYLLNSYFLRSNKKLHILLKSKIYLRQKNEINFYKRFFTCKCVFLKSKTKSSPYKILDKFENIIFTQSTLGYEAISRNKKTAIFPVNKDKVDRKIFGWPKKKQKNYDFFLPKKLTYSEVERVLNNISNCKQSNWNINHYKYIKDLMYFDKGNSQLNKIISKIIKIKI